MASRKKALEPFDLKASQIKGAWTSYEDIAGWVIRELETAIDTRNASGAEQDIKYAWDYYEQNRTRGASAPWPDAADLTSPMPSEYTDALHARAMQTIFTEPVYTVEGRGDAARRAPIVEEYIQYGVEDSRLQSYLDDCLMRAWVEGVGTLEISEAFEMRREQQRKRVKLDVDPASGMPVMGEDNQPALARNPDTGDYLDAEEQDTHTAEVDVDVLEPIRMGPEFDVVPYLDFLVLPIHARSRQQIWGYAKRFWRRVPELKARAALGYYDATAVEELGENNERQTITDEAPAVKLVADQRGPTAQKELYEVQVLADFDGKGERWYRLTVSLQKRQLLRLKRDDRTTRYIRFIPFPRPGSVDRGYSLITNKLLTVAEQDTAVRNMWADRAALAASAPVKRLQGALWDPYEQPIGPRSVLDVRDMNEVQPMEFKDVPQSVAAWKQELRNDADRLVGQNDTSLGAETGEQRTLGEVRLRAGYAEVRTDLIIKRLKEPMEELFQGLLNIYRRVLASKTDGMPMPQSVVVGLEARGFDMSVLGESQTMTADVLEGPFWGKPKGSVESADKNMQRALLNQFLSILPALQQSNPAFQLIFGSLPAAKSIAEQVVRLYNWSDKQAFLGTETQSALTTAAKQQEMMQNPQMQMLLAMAGGGGAPGMPGMGGPNQGGAPTGPEQAPPPGVM
jgi:hypothetical protein